MKPHKSILLIIIVSQFFCTSLWFAGNAVMDNLMLDFNLNASALGLLTSSVQFGFIIGTLVFALLSISDRYSPSKVFFCCAIMAAVFNLGIIMGLNTYFSIIVFRFFTGFFLAGIYPVGMKIASDYYEKGLGLSLGFLVGALVLGTAFPHLLNDMTNQYSWKAVLVITSVLSSLGGLLIFVFVPDGPHRKPSTKLQLAAFFSIFRKTNFRSAAFGYFGHMWELYALWAFVPIMLQSYRDFHSPLELNIPLLSFLIIGVGCVACVLAGYLTKIYDTLRIASTFLFLSCLCCLAFPFMFLLESESLFIGFLLFWGMVVIGDSPLFSALVAQNAPVELKGTALTIVNSIGFAITVISIQLISSFVLISDSRLAYILLAIGPVFGLIALKNKTSRSII